MYPMTNCPEAFSLGYRTTPGQKVPEFAGELAGPAILLQRKHALMPSPCLLPQAARLKLCTRLCLLMYLI